MPNPRLVLTEPVFINGQSKQHYAEVEEGWLSVKSMWQGSAVYSLSNNRVILDDRHYLILNDLQPYTIEIDQEQDVGSFCIFFPSQWAADVLQNFTVPEEQLLERFGEGISVSFFDVLHRHDNVVTPILNNLRLAHSQKKWQTETLHGLLAAMLQVQQKVYQEAAKLPATRTTTRKELYRRLTIGRDFIHANLNRPIALDDMAQVAALSPYHFLRSFKQLFGRTPHNYLTSQRLQMAQQLLLNTEMPVTEICFEVGFQSLGSFSTLFQKVNGRSPTQYRQEYSKRTF